MIKKPLEIALAEYGNEAYPGREHNPEVTKYFAGTGKQFIHDDETPWCAAFMNWVMQKANVITKNQLNARSFLDMGVESSDPVMGDVVVFWRISPTSWEGHVGLYIRETAKMIYVLGGNQDSSVKIKPFPKTQLLGYRKY